MSAVEPGDRESRVTETEIGQIGGDGGGVEGWGSGGRLTNDALVPPFQRDTLTNHTQHTYTLRDTHTQIHTHLETVIFTITFHPISYQPPL